jgi:hypothetical protein
MSSRAALAVLLLFSEGVICPALTKHPARDSARPPASAPKVRTAQAAEGAKDSIERIREEGLNRSQVMEIIAHLSDVIGPRLTASPAAKSANEWTRDRLAEWGLLNARLEAWGPFGRGWTLRRFSAQIVEPQSMPLIAYPKAWSPGTEGPVTAEVIYVDANSEEELLKYRGKLKGAVVITNAPRELKPNYEPLATRLTEKDLLELANAPDPKLTPSRPFRFTPERLAAGKLASRKNEFFTEEGAALWMEPSRAGDGGTIFVQGALVPQPFFDPFAPGAPKSRVPWDKTAPRMIPQVVVANEHYNRMVRLLRQGQRLKLSFDIAVEYQDADPMGYNTVAEIPGSDLKDEVVMVGGHLDSWHAGTGATDNAAGVAVAMEAVRILQALKLRPRRTIRIALWTGEEQGFLGSAAYVAQSFGTLRAPAQTSAATPADTPPAPRLLTKPEYEKFSAYFNLDNGAGKIRGIYAQANEAAVPLFRRWLMPLSDLGAATVSLANTGGTDHLAFDEIGLPGFEFIQDEIDYATRTRHSNQDVFDRVQADDVKQAAVVVATFIYDAAMTDERLPRKAARK